MSPSGGNRDFSWVRLVFVDLFGSPRSVQLPGAHLPAILADGIGVDGSALEGRARQLEADMLLRPDPSTLLDLGGGIARIVCDVAEIDGRRWPVDPRTALSRLLEDLGPWARSWRARAELEFYLLDSNLEPVDSAGYFSDLAGADRGAQVVHAAAARLDSYGATVISAHHEAGRGQHELDLAEAGPIALGDSLVLAKEVLKEEASAAGLRATFMARPISTEPGSGLHLQQRFALGSVHSASDPSEAPKAEVPARAVVGGLLSHASGLCAFAAPTVNSYRRLHVGPEAPGSAVWAHLNRAALVRLAPEGPGDPVVEFRGADPSANPYLLIAGMLAAISDGMDSATDPGPPMEESLEGFDPAAFEVAPMKLPRTLEAALDALVADDTLVDAFDDRLIRRYVEGRMADVELSQGHVSLWELGRYLDEA